MRRLSLLLVVLALVVAACSDAPAAQTTTTTAPTTLPSTTTTTTTTSTTTTTTTTTTATTTVPPGPRAPLTGLPVADEALLDRRVIAVKIDNHPAARPQSGLQEAEAVYELPVEYTFTRFMALFHTSDSAYVGPIRSARPTDRTLLLPLDASFQFSGAKVWIEGLLAASGVHLVPPGSDNTFRISTRVAPHNLYGLTPEMRELADNRGYPDEPPPPLFDYAPGLEIEGSAASWIDFSGSSKYGSTNWRWDGEQYLRFVGDTPQWWIDIDGDQGQIAADTLVVIAADPYTASPSDPSAGSSVPAYDTVGSGDVYVFAQGVIVTGTWARTTMEEPFLLRDGAGSLLTLPPGKPWIAIFPSNAALSWSD